jgi:purine-cytosine permease-like protein
VTFFNFSGYSVVQYFFWVLLVAAFVVEVWAFADAIRRPAPAFVAASKQTKPLWLIILGVAFVVGIGGAIYLADVRPKVREFKSGSSHQGPYGPW